jgi:lysozyme
MTTDDRAQLKTLLIRHEGLRLKPYKDTRGILTIGVGRNLDRNGLRPSEVQFMLDNDVADVLAGLDRVLPWFQQLDAVRQRVLADMAFNLGCEGLLAFKRTLAAVERGEWAAAAAAMEASLWAHQVGDGPGGRVDRAEELAQMMETGRDPA